MRQYTPKERKVCYWKEMMLTKDFLKYKTVAFVMKNTFTK